MPDVICIICEGHLLQLALQLVGVYCIVSPHWPIYCNANSETPAPTRPAISWRLFTLLSCFSPLAHIMLIVKHLLQLILILAGVIVYSLLPFVHVKLMVKQLLLLFLLLAGSYCMVFTLVHVL